LFIYKPVENCKNQALWWSWRVLPPRPKGN